MSNNKQTYSVLEYVALLGYPAPKSPTVLGKQIAKAYRDAGLGEPQTNLRDVRGKQTPVKVYEPSIAPVDEVIHKYYANQSSD